MAMQLKKRPLLFIISGPSGVGKDSVIGRMKELGLPFYYAVTATSRPKRASEQEGVHYYFVTEHRFKLMVARDELLEHARVYDNYYGVPRKEIEKPLADGRDVLLKLDVQGASTIKKLIPSAVAVFLMPPTFTELARRLKGRESEPEEALTRRLKTFEKEMETLPVFDYAVVNHYNALDKTIATVEAIITAEKCRIPG
jgi:guanylate kinase